MLLRPSKNAKRYDSIHHLDYFYSVFIAEVRCLPALFHSGLRTAFKFLYIALIVCADGRAGTVKARQEAEALKAEQEAEAKAKQEAVARKDALKVKQEAEANAKHEAVARQEAEALKVKQEAEANVKHEALKAQR